MEGKDTVVYSIENKKFTPFYDGDGLLSELSPSLWVTFEKLSPPFCDDGIIYFSSQL